jgi:hypothetical protein
MLREHLGYFFLDVAGSTAFESLTLNVFGHILANIFRQRLNAVCVLCNELIESLASASAL